MSELVVNGERRSFPQVATVLELVAALKMVPETLLIEHNGVALNRSEWNGRALADGDRIEFVRLAAGG